MLFNADIRQTFALEEERNNYEEVILKNIHLTTKKKAIIYIYIFTHAKRY